MEVYHFLTAIIKNGYFTTEKASGYPNRVHFYETGCSVFQNQGEINKLQRQNGKFASGGAKAGDFYI